MRKVATVSYRLKPALVALAWGTCLAAITLWAIFQGLLLPRVQGGLIEVLEGEPWRLAIYYASIFGVSVLAAIILNDFAKALGSFFASYGLGAVITYWVLALPSFTGAYSADLAFRELIVTAGVDFTFRAFFPIPLFLELMATILGVALAEFRALG